MIAVSRVIAVIGEPELPLVAFPPSSQYGRGLDEFALPITAMTAITAILVDTLNRMSVTQAENVSATEAARRPLRADECVLAVIDIQEKLWVAIHE
ncbi:MAG TPA: hypothetical protein VN176_02500, partial [Verrucomicrobiae bacterium]|nr:hypothetical protein [Verrucomicrobiae bacterium]